MNMIILSFTRSPVFSLLDTKQDIFCPYNDVPQKKVSHTMRVNDDRMMIIG